VRVALGSDDETPLVEHIHAALANRGHDVLRVAVGEPWPEVGHAVAQAVVEGSAERGVVCCWTGTGVSIAANKVPGVRAALCTDAATAAGARRWNDANVLALGLRLTSPEVAGEMIDAFFSTAPDDEDLAAIARIEPPAEADGSP
jgi:ribose 5-phosphate isomerase B